MDSIESQLVVEGYLNMFWIALDFIQVKRANIRARKIRTAINTPTLRQFCCATVT